jgi:hypothetical protein
MEDCNEITSEFNICSDQSARIFLICPSIWKNQENSGRVIRKDIKFGLFCVDSFIYILMAGGQGFAFIIFPLCGDLNTFFAQGM